MRTVTIPGTDLRPSAICLGTGSIGSAIDRSTSFAMLDAFVEQGGNFLDTASVYANWLPIERSISEKTIGQWLAARRNRSRMLIGTKGAHPDLATMHIPRMSRAEIVADLDASLANLQTDVIDLYWLHRDDPGRPVAEILDVLFDQVRAGKIRYFGCSNWRRPRIEAAQAYASLRRLTGFVADQMMWSLAVTDPAAMLDRTITVMDDDLKAYHRRTGLATIPYSSQANGLFQKLAQGGMEQIKQAHRRVYPMAANEARLKRIQELAAESGLSVTQIVLGYLTSQPFRTVPIVGCRTMEQLLDSLSAGDARLSEEQLRHLEAS